MFGKLAGKKTYIASAIGILSAVAGYLTGDIVLADAVQLVLTALLGATVRHGISEGAKK